MKRQSVLYDRVHIPFSFIVEEHVFRRRLDGSEVMRGVLDHVLKLGARRSATLQITPMDAESHACFDGLVWLLETPKGQRVAYPKGSRAAA